MAPISVVLNLRPTFSGSNIKQVKILKWTSKGDITIKRIKRNKEKQTNKTWKYIAD